MDDFAKKIMARIDENIRKHGLHVQAIGGGHEDGGGYSYTIGLTDVSDHPEIFMAGFSPDMMHSLINIAGRYVIDGVANFSKPCLADKIIEGYDVAFRPLTVESANEYGLLAQDHFHKATRGVQLFLPDMNGKFPWDEGCHPDYVKLQTALLEAEGDIPVERQAGPKPH